MYHAPRSDASVEFMVTAHAEAKYGYVPTAPVMLYHMAPPLTPESKPERPPTPPPAPLSTPAHLTEGPLKPSAKYVAPRAGFGAAPLCH